MNSPSSTLSLSLVRGWIALGDMLKLLPAFHWLQAGFLVVAGTGAFILAAGDVEFVGHSQADGAVKVVAILGDIGADAVGGPPLLAGSEDVVGIEVDQQRLVEKKQLTQ